MALGGDALFPSAAQRALSAVAAADTEIAFWLDTLSFEAL